MGFALRWLSLLIVGTFVATAIGVVFFAVILFCALVFVALVAFGVLGEYLQIKADKREALAKRHKQAAISNRR